MVEFSCIIKRVVSEIIINYSNEDARVPVIISNYTEYSLPCKCS